MVNKTKVKMCEFPKELNNHGFYECIHCKRILPKGLPPNISRACTIKNESVWELSKTYLKEKNIWKKMGKPMRSAKRIHEIFHDICKMCPYFQPKGVSNGKCLKCGCHLKDEGTTLNKLAWATTKCPLEPPKWIEELSSVKRASIRKMSKDCGCD